MLVEQIVAAEGVGEGTRFIANAPALLYTLRGEPLEVLLTNISAHGFRVESDNVACAGDVVWLRIGGGPLVESKVVWERPGSMGCIFAIRDDPRAQDLASRYMLAVDREYV